MKPTKINRVIGLHVPTIKEITLACVRTIVISLVIGGIMTLVHHGVSGIFTSLNL